MCLKIFTLVLFCIFASLQLDESSVLDWLNNVEEDDDEDDEVVHTDILM